jgi:hypothetical protein
LVERTEDRRLCPTRSSGAHSLIAHWITPGTCLERQRRNYHKSFSCSYRGLGAEAVLPPPAPPPPPASMPVVVPVRKATSKKLKSASKAS